MKKDKKIVRTVTMKARDLSRNVEFRLSYILGLCCILYNAALEERIQAYKKYGISRTYFDQCKELTEIRRQDPTYNELNLEMLRLTALYRLNAAFQGFFTRLKEKKKKAGFPRYRKRSRFTTLVFGKTGWTLKGRKIWVTGVGQIRLTSVPEFEGKPIGLRIVRRISGWYIHFIVELGTVPSITTSDNMVGIDVGLNTFATISDGSTIENPRFVRESLEQLKNLQQKLSTKKPGSNNRRKAKLKLARYYEKVTNKRKDFLHKASRQLVDKYDGFIIEDLDIQQMVDSDRDVDGLSEKGQRGLRRGILDAAWGQFGSFMAYKAEEAGKLVLKVEPKGTSQKCSNCGSLVKKTLKDRTHECPVCGLNMDRDLNAAMNIYNLGWRLMGDLNPMECP